MGYKQTLKEEMAQYESQAAVRLKTKTPVFVCLKGRSFGVLTQHFRKPYDSITTRAMQLTAKQLCTEANGCVFAYTASNETNGLSQVEQRTMAGL